MVGNSLSTTSKRSSRALAKTAGDARRVSALRSNTDCFRALLAGRTGTLSMDTYVALEFEKAIPAAPRPLEADALG